MRFPMLDVCNSDLANREERSTKSRRQAAPGTSISGRSQPEALNCSQK